MNWKKIFVICIVVGIASFLMSLVLYIGGGYELFKAQDNYNYTR